MLPPLTAVLTLKLNDPLTSASVRDIRLICACEHVEVRGGGRILYPQCEGQRKWIYVHVCVLVGSGKVENNKAGPSGNWMSCPAFLAELA